MSDVRILHPSKAQTLWFTILRWVDSWAGLERMRGDGPPRMDWLRCIPIIAVHLMCLGVIWVGWSWTALVVAIAFYFLRMFAITGWYHRYFSHRTFKTSRACQFAFAILGGSCAQRGPLWWAGPHRHHHIASDPADDVPSPRQNGFCGRISGGSPRKRTLRRASKGLRTLPSTLNCGSSIASIFLSP